MHKITKSIGNSTNIKNIDSSKKVEINKVLICRPNHRLGNLLLTTPLIQEVQTTFPNAKIDLLIQGGLGPILFKNYKNIDSIIQLPKRPFKYPFKYLKSVISFKKKKYDIAINAVVNSSSGRLFTQFSNSKYKVIGEENDLEIQSEYKDYQHIAKHQVYTFRNFVTKLGCKKNNEPVASLNLKLSSSEIKQGKSTLNNIIKNDKKTICLFTFATDDKCHSEDWWLPFYEALKNKYSTYNIIEVLPIENISMIQFKAPTFYSKEIREIGALIANTEVFIGADSGIMHLASASQTPTVGLFSRNNQIVYQPFNVNDIAVYTPNVTITECIDIVDEILKKK